MIQQNRTDRHDPLHYLQKSAIIRYAKGDVIGDGTGGNGRLFLVLNGRVQVFHADNNGKNVLLHIVEPEGFFGEAGLWGAAPWLNQTISAAAPTELMSWTAAEIEAQILREPALGLALLEKMTERISLLRDRIFALSVLPNRARLMVTLRQLAEIMGEPTETGILRLRSLTHQMIADYTGTSREIVTMELNWLRRISAINYARSYIDVDLGALDAQLKHEGAYSFCPEPTQRAASVLL
jgi:CRP/FNR family transcriptional regulator, cyclic AMP receptor protein